MVLTDFDQTVVTLFSNYSSYCPEYHWIHLCYNLVVSITHLLYFMPSCLCQNCFMERCLSFIKNEKNYLTRSLPVYCRILIYSLTSVPHFRVIKESWDEMCSLPIQDSLFLTVFPGSSTNIPIIIWIKINKLTYFRLIKISATSSLGRFFAAILSEFGFNYGYFKEL